MKRCIAWVLALLVLSAGAARADNRVVLLGDYRGIPVDAVTPEITEAEFEEQVEYMLSLYATTDESGKLVTPELTDEFAREHLNADSADAYRERLRGILLEEKAEALSTAQKESFIRSLIDCSEVVLDDASVDARVGQYTAMYQGYCTQLGISLEQFALEYYNLDLATFEQAIREQAEYDLRGETLLTAVAEDMGIVLPQEEYLARRGAFSRKYGLTEETAEERYSEEKLREMFLRDMLWETLLGGAE